ncbi:RodZ domain-containing protein [Aquipseudomonas ullengensis]|uniref:Helix-turn-helix domain-containing protein n=1 Tax=Aquipseudomonas ullengensis TaxID=2759166 RepID=A0A7W4QEG9_9GAMM|nr:RodZ family helix-turn-helix domain-containing protein [Pseudomonas ullengensis]MBB2495603.1 helix-turn-helix domain-containing protein [Pseudomonas ullengensis]
MKASHPEVAAATRVNPGETLRKARENKEWALADVAAQLNLTVQALRLVESGAFEQLPGHTFSRGYVRSYAKLLGMDSNRLVADFDQYTGTDSQGSSVASLGRIEEPARVSHNLLRGFSVLVLVALGAAGFFWWQGESNNSAARLANTSLEHVEVEAADGTTEIHPLDEPEDQAIVEVQGDDEQPVVDPAAESGVPAEAPPVVAGETVEAPVSTAAPVVPESAPASTTAPANTVAPVAPAPVPAPAEPVAVTPPAVAASAPAATPAAGDSRVSLMFSADCWTQLTDASGKVLVSALKRKGESVELYGKAPFELRLGYARGAVVSFNGQQVDVGPFTHGETARLKLGQ